MAGYICKIVIEDTHPPVWRRVVIPEKITFFELHQIIQTVFQWEEVHLHDFRIPSDDIVINDEGEDGWGYDYGEFDTTIDCFFENYKWIRYTYDFGDDWRHRINIEKYDPDYTERCPKLLKYKGDNFMEDSGGIWAEEMGGGRYPFDKEFVESQLDAMSFPEHEQKKEIASTYNLIDDLGSIEKLKKLYNKFKNMTPEEFDIMIRDTLRYLDMEDESDLLNKKIEDWENFAGQNITIKMMKSSKTVKKLLENLSEKQSNDYYKYLMISEEKPDSHKKRISIIANILKEHPEYILYVLSQDEYENVKKWLKYPMEEKIEILDNQYIFTRALMLGLLDYEIKGDVAEIYLASDIEDYIGVLDRKTENKIYRQLDKLDDRVGKLIQIYCVIELDELYEIYKKLYQKKQKKEEFFRYIYWHARFNDLLMTYYKTDGTAYAGMKGLDIYEILEKRDVYAKNLSFNEISAYEIDELTENIANRCETVDFLFMTLQGQFHMSEQDAANALFEAIEDIMNGKTLDVIIENIKDWNMQKWSPDLYAEMWSMISDLMLELEIPMLKGRTRNQYADEQNISPWSIGMLSDQIDDKNTKKRHLYEFPMEIQQWMYDAETAGMREDIERLFVYKESNHIISEEFIYMLSSISIMYDYTYQAEALMKELKKSSADGKKTARILEAEMDQYNNIMDFEDDWTDDELEDFMFQEMEKREPYVKTEPKIGRNDPCPCGSGKKYKKCCGRNL